jgi:hypothetical protein
LSHLTTFQFIVTAAGVSALFGQYARLTPPKGKLGRSHRSC